MDREDLEASRMQFQLLAWCSPAYPTGAFSYSHGLEWAVERRGIRDAAGLWEYVAAVLERGGGWVDAVLFVHAWRAARREAAGQLGARRHLSEIAELAAAFRATRETALESRQQGAAFLEVTLQAWPHPLLAQFAADLAGRAVAHCAAVAVSCAAHGVALDLSLQAFLQASAANLVSAGARLIPLGQTDAQRVIARLAPCVTGIAARALYADLADLGTCAPGLELCSMHHETQYTRLFRS